MQNLYIFHSNGGPVCSTNMKAILTSVWSSRSLDQFLLYMCDDSTAVRRTCMKHVGKWGYDAQKISSLESVCYRFFQVIHVHTHTLSCHLPNLCTHFPYLFNSDRNSCTWMLWCDCSCLKQELYTSEEMFREDLLTPAVFKIITSVWWG